MGGRSRGGGSGRRAGNEGSTALAERPGSAKGISYPPPARDRDPQPE